jgi:hypothetical protein
MTYWLSMASVLLVGYVLIKRSGRVNEQENEGDSGTYSIATAGELDLRSPATLKSNREARHQGENEGNYGGEA